jgi:hypothetical protein
MSLESWSELWNFKINDFEIQAVGSSGGDGPVDSHLTLKGQSIPFLKRELLGVIFDRRLYTDTIEAKAFRTFIRVCGLLPNVDSRHWPPPFKCSVLKKRFSFVSCSCAVTRSAGSRHLHTDGTCPAATF